MRRKIDANGLPNSILSDRFANLDEIEDEDKDAAKTSMRVSMRMRTTRRTRRRVRRRRTRRQRWLMVRRKIDVNCSGNSIL